MTHDDDSAVAESNSCRRGGVAITASGGKSERVSSCRRYTAFRCDDAMGARALTASAM
jgi:hypothetical protein